jgi:hypothetical protein
VWRERHAGRAAHTCLAQQVAQIEHAAEGVGRLTAAVSADITTCIRQTSSRAKTTSLGRFARPMAAVASRVLGRAVISPLQKRRRPFSPPDGVFGQCFEVLRRPDVHAEQAIAPQEWIQRACGEEPARDAAEGHDLPYTSDQAKPSVA